MQTVFANTLRHCPIDVFITLMDSEVRNETEAICHDIDFIVGKIRSAPQHSDLVGLRMPGDLANFARSQAAELSPAWGSKVILHLPEPAAVERHQSKLVVAANFPSREGGHVASGLSGQADRKRPLLLNLPRSSWYSVVLPLISFD
jgi:hypothetical protein